MSRVITYAQALNEAMAGEMARDPGVFIMGEDIAEPGGMFTVTRGLLQMFGADRVIDAPIAENGFLGLGVGAAIAGMRPIIELMFIDFALLAADQILNQATKMSFLSGGQARVPLTIRTQQGIVGGGGAQHSQSLEALFASVPGLAIAMPAIPADAKGLLTAAIRSNDPVMVIEHKGLYFSKGEVPEGDHVVPLGSAVVRYSGTDVTVVAYSGAVRVALEAAEQLKTEGISVEVVDLRTIVPLDLATIVSSVEKTGRLVVAHESSVFGGMGGEIVACITEKAWSSLKSAPLRVGGLDMPIPYARSLEQLWLINSADISRAVKKALG